MAAMTRGKRSALGSELRLDLAIARLSFRRQSAYRAANWAGWATNTFFGAVRSFVFIGLYSSTSQSSVLGYSLADTLAYTWISQSLLMYVYLWGWWEISETIRTGQIASDLSKPYDYYRFWLAGDLGRGLYHLIWRGAPTYVTGALLFGIPLPADPLIWLGFGATLIVALLISFSIRFLLNLTTFWLLDHRGVALFSYIFLNFFSGLLIPLAFLPDWLQAITSVLPFQSIIWLPTLAFLGKLQGVALVESLAFGLVWFFVLYALGQVVLEAATRRLVIQGG